MRNIGFLLFCLFLILSCTKKEVSESSVSSEKENANFDSSPSLEKEQPLKLEKKLLTFSNGIQLTVEMADTFRTRQRGLMHRKSLPKNEGMLFVFDRPHILSFWMKNTFIPLSIAFFDKEKKLINIESMEPQKIGPRMQQDLRSYESKKYGLFAVEVNNGWFEKNKIIPGMDFKIKD